MSRRLNAFEINQIHVQITRIERLTDEASAFRALLERGDMTIQTYRHIVNMIFQIAAETAGQSNWLHRYMETLNDQMEEDSK